MIIFLKTTDLEYLPAGGRSPVSGFESVQSVD